MTLISKIFKDYRLFEILILGVISGMPLSILYTSLAAYLKDFNVDIAIITTFAVARISYSLKVFWSPLVDYFKIPLLKRFGHRKSWMILCSSLISLVLFGMSRVSPDQSLTLLYFLAIALGFLSATFDINVDALRIDKFDQETQAIASASAVLGYRLGMLITGAGALYFAEVTNWSDAFVAMSVIFIISTIFIITVREKEIIRDKINNFAFFSLIKMLFSPLKEFFVRKYAITILLAIIFFKLGDAMLAVVSMPFYMELGYTKGQIALISKFYGLLATLFGSFAGGILVYKIGIFRGLIITGIVQSITHFAFMWLNHQPVSSEALLIAITIENLGAAMGGTALVGYISNLCNKQYSASQYALLSASATLFNNTITAYGGSLVKMLGWDNYFIVTVILALPSLVILLYLNNRVSKDL